MTTYITGLIERLLGRKMQALRAGNLGAEAAAALKALQVEVDRHETIRASHLESIRYLCGEDGDNDWPDNLHLGDAVEKHLVRHLAARAEKAEAEIERLREALSEMVETFRGYQGMELTRARAALKDTP